jgi:hypothetical protein
MNAKNLFLTSEGKWEDISISEEELKKILSQNNK